ncbi:MAG: Holliday junction resolvase RuvX [Candidatus Moranbacteria bacterium]|nr:Holliday junction resolvase RuvX [Candidatus Moranbacteria bacterium]
MYLGIDWGEKKIGLAIADEEMRMAFANQVVLNDKNIWKNLAEIIDEYSIEKVVIGLSAHKIQSDNEKKIRFFSEELKNKFDIEIIFTEEMFSTREAQTNLKAQEVKKLDSKDDAEAARILLQSYLDNK